MITARELAALLQLLETTSKQQDNSERMIAEYKKRRLTDIAENEEKLWHRIGLALSDVRRMIEREYCVEYYKDAEGESIPENSVDRRQ